MAIATILLLGVLQASDVTVYVFTKTDPSGFTDPLQAQRVESLEHLRTALDKRKGITLAERADDADLTLEILDAGKLETGASRTKGLSTGWTAPFSALPHAQRSGRRFRQSFGPAAISCSSTAPTGA